MSETPTPETDAEAMEKLALVRKQLVAMKELNEARRECNEAQEGWNKALDERDEARKELAETISCIEQAIDFHQVHHQSFQASAIKNLLENINQRRKHE